MQNANFSGSNKFSSSISRNSNNQTEKINRSTFRSSNRPLTSRDGYDDGNYYHYECENNYDENTKQDIINRITCAHLKRFENDIMLNEINFIFHKLQRTGDINNNGVNVDRNTISVMENKLNEGERNLVSFRKKNGFNKSISTLFENTVNRRQNLLNKKERLNNYNEEDFTGSKTNYNSNSRITNNRSTQNIENEENIINEKNIINRTNNIKRNQSVDIKEYSNKSVKNQILNKSKTQKNPESLKNSINQNKPQTKKNNFNKNNNKKHRRPQSANKNRHPNYLESNDNVNYEEENENYPENYNTNYNENYPENNKYEPNEGIEIGVNTDFNKEPNVYDPNKISINEEMNFTYTNLSKQPPLNDNPEIEIPPEKNLQTNETNINVIPDDTNQQLPGTLRNKKDEPQIENNPKNTSNYPEKSPDQNIQNPENIQPNIVNKENYPIKNYSENPNKNYSPQNYPKKNYNQQNYPNNIYNNQNYPENPYPYMPKSYRSNRNRGPNYPYPNYPIQRKKKQKNKNSPKNLRSPKNKTSYQKEQSPKNYGRPLSNNLIDKYPQNQPYISNYVTKPDKLRNPEKKRNLSFSNKNINKNYKYGINYGYPAYSTCFACDVKCSISRSGNSPNTYNPYLASKKVKRKHVTPLGNDVVYEQYTRRKKTPEEIENAMYSYA